MERTQPEIVASLFLQPHITGDHLYYIVSGSDLFDQLFRIIHAFAPLVLLFCGPYFFLFCKISDFLFYRQISKINSAILFIAS